MNLDRSYSNVNEAILDGFRTPQKLAYLLRSHLGKRLNEITLADNLVDMVATVVDVAESEGWIEDLLLSALKQNRGNVKLRALAQQLSLIPTVMIEPEAIVVSSNAFFDVNAWNSRLNELESCVCRVETPDTSGTGFLVGPDIVITNYHVMQPVFDSKADPERVRLLFDHKKLANGKILPGSRYRLAKQWCIDASPPSPIDEMPYFKGREPQTEELDYVLLRTQEKLGYDEISGKGKPNARKRHWIELTTSVSSIKPGSGLIILQYPSHPSPVPLKMALDTQAILDSNENGTRIRYRTNTEKGSSGSPCFSMNLELVALHRGGNATYNEGIPLSMIQFLLTKRGLYESITSTF